MPANTHQASGMIDRSYVRRAMKTPMLEQAHEISLARKWREHEDERALHELTSAYMRLVISMAARFRNYGLPMSDLVQEGNVGLMQAAARFDPEREVRFSTYASWWIRSAIQDYVLRNWSIVRTGTTAAQKSLFFNLRRLRAKINDLDDAPLSSENRSWIASHLGVPERDVETMVARLSGGDHSLNAPISVEGGGEWQDLLTDESATPDEILEARLDGSQRQAWIADALTILNERELMIIRERRLSETTVTLEVLGQQLGISKERVRQIEHQALGKLRRALEKIVGDPETSGLLPNV